MTKKEEYKEYIENHQSNVEQVWYDIQEFLEYEYALEDHVIDEINYLIFHHDDSKLSNEEFEGYKQYFYPEDGEEKDKYDMEVAWNHHQKANPHHWQYWIMWEPEGSVALDMPFRYVIEMLCDWTAMSYKFKKTSPVEWWKEEQKEVLMTMNTLKIVDSMIPVFEQVYQKYGLEE